MKILATSDLHGNLPNIKESFDLLLICGDICPAHDQYYSYQEEWFRNDFISWIKSLPFKDNYSKVVMTWGNHDFVGERTHKNETEKYCKLSDNRLVILKNEIYSFDYWVNNKEYNVSIFGTPYCKIFGNWAFMVDDDKLNNKYLKCPEGGVDIFISHDSPTTNGLGLINEGHQCGVDAGNKTLANIIGHKRYCKYFFSGHIHSGNHKLEEITPNGTSNTYMANVSLVNERYNPVYPILSLEMNNDSKEIKEFKYLDVECLDF